MLYVMIYSMLFIQFQRHKCGTLKNPHCSMAMSAEHTSKFAALHW